MQENDPDEELCLPTREVQAALGLADALLKALNANPQMAAQLAAVMPPLDPSVRLPEVGRIEDGHELRLHLRRLAERLAVYVPGASSEGRIVEEPEEKFGEITFSRATKSMALEGDDYELANFSVWWDEITSADIARYRDVLEAAADERPIQRYLASNPLILVQHLHGGHGRWVLPQKRLGSEYVPDFILAERNSAGFEWQFVELQSPQAELFIPSTGRNSAQLDEGLRQIEEWRRWLEDNRPYARNPKAQNGLGLRNISANFPGLLLIGREAKLTDSTRERRRQLGGRYNIHIRTYDWLLREAESRVRAVSQKRYQRPGPQSVQD
jgi:hypothetical protein